MKLVLFLLVLLLTLLTFSEAFGGVVEIVIEYGNETTTTTTTTTSTTLPTTTTLPPGGGGGGGGWPTTTTTTLPQRIGPVLTYSLPVDIPVNLGEDASFKVTVVNKGDVVLHDVVISLSGLPNVSFSVSPQKLYTLDVNLSYSFRVLVDTSNLPPGMYPLTVLIGSQEVNHTTTASITVKPVTKEEEKKEEAKPILGMMSIILLSIMISGLVVAVVMLYRHLQKRCPLCGGRLREEYKGVNIIAYKCTKCAREIYESRKEKRTAE